MAKEYKHYVIYQITNLVNGMIYIGQHSTNDLDDGYMGSGKRLHHAYKKYGIENVLNTYFDNILEALESGIDFDVLSHVDFGFKSAYLIDNSIKISLYEDKLINIFKRLIELDKTLEINIKVQSFINDEHTKYILRLYKKVGGKNLTLSSDAHSIERFYKNFEHYIGIIKDEGFDHLNYFINRTRFDLRIID